MSFAKRPVILPSLDSVETTRSIDTWVDYTTIKSLERKSVRLVFLWM